MIEDRAEVSPATQPKRVLARAARSVRRAVTGIAEILAEAAVRVATGAARRVASRQRERRARREPLPNLSDIHPEARMAARRELGLMTIPVGRIRGTAVEGRPQRGGDFLPLPELRGSNWRGRWQRLRAAQEQLAVLPPIDVLQTDDGYWVLDGHNRVALARLVGQDDIDAAVTHVHLPGTHDDDLPRGPLESILADSLEVRSAARQRRDEPRQVP